MDTYNLEQAIIGQRDDWYTGPWCVGHIWYTASGQPAPFPPHDTKFIRTLSRAGVSP